MKEGICTAVGVVGSAIAAAFGGWDQALVTLVIFMVIDYLSGLIVAGIFHNSRKTENGALESRAGWKGLCRKGVTLLFVLIAYRLDLALGVNYIRNAVIIGFMAIDQHHGKCRADGNSTSDSDPKCNRSFDTKSICVKGW